MMLMIVNGINYTSDCLPSEVFRQKNLWIHVHSPPSMAFRNLEIWPRRFGLAIPIG